MRILLQMRLIKLQIDVGSCDPHDLAPLRCLSMIAGRWVLGNTTTNNTCELYARKLQTPVCGSKRLNGRVRMIQRVTGFDHVVCVGLGKSNAHFEISTLSG